MIYDIIQLFKNNNIKIDIKKELNKLYKNEKINEECCICKNDNFEIGYIELKCLHVFHRTCVTIT